MTPETGPEVDHLRETPTHRTAVYRGRLLQVFEDEVRLPDGRSARREVVEHRGAVGIVAVDAGRVVLVRQWRHAVGGAIWEIPAGTRDEGEEPWQTAPRELAEETGFTADRWHLLGSAGVSPGYSRELLWFFLAEGLHAGDVHTDADETLDVRMATPTEIADLVHAGAVDAKTLAGLAMAGFLPHVPPRPMPG